MYRGLWLPEMYDASPASSSAGRLRIVACESLTTISVAPPASAPSMAALTSPSSSRRPAAACGPSPTHCSQSTTPAVPSMSLDRKIFIWASGGNAGVQAGEESGALRSGAGFCRHRLAGWQREDGVRVPALSRRSAAGGAEPHLRLRPRGLERHPGYAAAAIRNRAHGHVVRPGIGGADGDEERPAAGLAERGVPCPAAAGPAPPAAGVRRVLRQKSPLSAVQVPPGPPGGRVHPVGVHPARRAAAPGQDPRPAGVRVVV